MTQSFQPCICLYHGVIFSICLQCAKQGRTQISHKYLDLMLGIATFKSYWVSYTHE